MFGGLLERNSGSKSSYSDDKIRKLALALEDGRFAVYRATREVGDNPFLVFLDAGTSLEEYRSKWIGAGVVPLAIESQPLSEEELWDEFEKANEGRNT